MEEIERRRERQNSMIRLMRQACEAAIRNSNTSMEECPMVWDGIMCWSSSPAGQLMTQSCPSYIVGFDSERLASRQCTAEGQWLVSLTYNHTWTNYSMCYSSPYTSVEVHYPYAGLDNYTDFAYYLPIMKTMSNVGYGVSLVTLLVAFSIFATFKRLRCPRNRLHMHLFASFMMRAFLTLLKDFLFVRGIGLASDFMERDGESYFIHKNETSWRCKSLVSMWQYFIMANYSWILMEGLYLHNLIFFAVFSDTSSIALFIVLGWGLPLLFVLPWVLVRIFLEDTLCWTTNENSYHFQLIKGPTTASVLVNFVLFINIIRVLRSKLNASISEETRRSRYRRWAKSTLVLVPLFGVHYAVYLTTSYLELNGSTELVFLFIDQLFASFQGFMVAVLYCLLNGEVRTELGRKWRHLSWRTRTDHCASLPLNSSQPSQSHSLSLPPLRNRSCLGGMFSRRWPRAYQNACKRGSSADTCMSTLVSSAASDQNTTTTFSTQTRRSMVPDITLNSGDTAASGAHQLT